MSGGSWSREEATDTEIRPTTDVSSVEHATVADVEQALDTRELG